MVVIVNQSFIEPSQIWIRRHADGLNRYVPIIVANKVTIIDASYNVISAGRDTLSRKILGRISQVIFRDYDKQGSYFDWYLLTKAIKSSRPDIIHFHFIWNAIFYFEYNQTSNIPIVITAHGTDVNAARVDETYRKKLVAAVIRVDVVLCVSFFIKQMLLNLGCPEEKLVVNHLGVPVDTFRSRQHSGATNPVQFICVSALREEKGIDHLINSFFEASKVLNDATLLVVGDGPLKSQLESQVKSLNLDKKVFITGWCTQAEVAELMFKSDIYVQHSIVYERNGSYPVIKEEGLSVSLVEAAASGLPIISTRVGGIPEICQDQINGYIVAPLDIHGMAERMIELAQDFGLRARMGSQGRLLVEQFHNESLQIQKLEELYDNVLEAHIKT